MLDCRTYLLVSLARVRVGEGGGHPVVQREEVSVCGSEIRQEYIGRLCLIPCPPKEALEGLIDDH